MVSRNYFRENRKAVQKGIVKSRFLQPLTEDDLPLRITEDKAILLKEVIIENVPADSDGIRPKSWLLDLEMDKPVFGTPQHTKTTESALILLGSDAFYVFMVELKSSLQPYKDGKNKKDDTLEGIKSKFEHTIGRISMLLPIYILGSEFNDLPILYKGIVCYNNDKVIISKSKEDQNFEKSLMFQAFNTKKTMLSLNDVFDRTHEVEVFFFKNPDNSETSFTLNFDDFFLEEWEAQAAVAGELTCPILSDLP